MTNLPRAGEPSGDEIRDVKLQQLPISRKPPPQSIRSSLSSDQQGVVGFHSPNYKLLLLILITISFLLFTLVQIHSLHETTTTLSSSLQFTGFELNQTNHHDINQDPCDMNNTNTMMMIEKLRRSVTFLPLKDLRYADSPNKGHTWFMSNMEDTQEKEGEFLHQHFPSNTSDGRILCLKGNDTHDGSRNYYGLAYPEALPEKAILVKGLTFVSNNHYDYVNLFHGLTNLFPLTAWVMRDGGCKKMEGSKWFLYHWGELRSRISPWLKTLVEATCGGDGGGEIRIHGSNESSIDEGPFCFEEAIVTRHNEGGMSRLRREQVFDVFRCKARVYCNVGRRIEKKKKDGVIGLTMLMRSGNRSFKNDSVVIDIFKEVCRQFDGCQLQVAYSDNLTFCQQVQVMSETDMLVSPHGAQLINMFFMDKNSSVLEFFPKGWLELAGVGQYVYRSLASWSGMRHRGAWRDPDGPNCPNPEDHRNCMSFYKNRQIGHNHTYFSQWAKEVLSEIKAWKMVDFSNGEVGESERPCS